MFERLAKRYLGPFGYPNTEMSPRYRRVLRVMLGALAAAFGGAALALLPWPASLSWITNLGAIIVVLAVATGFIVGPFGFAIACTEMWRKWRDESRRGPDA